METIEEKIEIILNDQIKILEKIEAIDESIQAIRTQIKVKPTKSLLQKLNGKKNIKYIYKGEEIVGAYYTENNNPHVVKKFTV